MFNKVLSTAEAICGGMRNRIIWHSELKKWMSLSLPISPYLPGSTNWNHKMDLSIACDPAENRLEYFQDKRERSARRSC